MKKTSSLKMENSVSHRRSARDPHAEQWKGRREGHRSNEEGGPARYDDKAAVADGCCKTVKDVPEREREKRGAKAGWKC